MLQKKCSQSVFQQDNDPKPRQQVSWFQTNKINVMEWPAHSPDLDLIKNLWSDIKNAVSEEKPGMLSNIPGLEYLLTGARSWSTP